MTGMRNCPYRDVSFAKEELCILDPDHLAMETSYFVELVKKTIREFPEDVRFQKEQDWNKYSRVIKSVKERCPHLDRDGIYDSDKRVTWIPDDLETPLKLIPDSSLGPKCRCLYPHKYQK